MNNIKETDSHEEKGDVPWGEALCDDPNNNCKVILRKYSVSTQLFKNQPPLLVLQNTQLHCLRDRVVVIFLCLLFHSQYCQAL